MFKKILAFILTIAVFVSSVSAVLITAAATETKQMLNISVVTTKADNDLLKTLLTNYDGVKRYTSLDTALNNAESDGISGVMVLADNYPNTTTAVTTTQAQKINELGIRLYIEYARANETLGITGYSGLGKMGYDRAIVMDSSALNMPLYSILYVHGAQYVKKTDITNSWLVNATVAGYDTVEFYDDSGLTDCTPYSLLETGSNGNVLIASTKLSQFITARYAPYIRWQKLWLSILSWVSQKTVTSIEWTPAVNPNYTAAEQLADNAYSEAVRLNTEWYINNMIDPNGSGIYQCFLSGGCFNAYGEQAKSKGVRADCNGESIGAIALAGVILNNQEYKDLAYNTMKWMLTESKMANGDRADPTNSQYGLFSWYDDDAYLKSYYGDDNAKAILGLILGSAALQTNEFDERILEGILGNFRTSGTNGFRGSNLSGDDIVRNGWEYYYNRTPSPLYRPHFEALLWACYLWAYDKTGYTPLLERTKTGISLMMTAYDETMKRDDDSGAGEWKWTNGMQQERAKMIWALSWLVQVEPTDKHISWLDKMITDMMRYQDTGTGALREAIGEQNEGSGEFGAFTKNSDYGKHESPVIQNNGDPCTDSLYTSSFAMVALNEAAAALRASSNTAKATEYQNYAKSISDYEVRIQQVSDTNSKYNGVWFRGFDYEKWEAYGSDGDAGWGIWCTETGWSQAQISSALSLQTLGTNIWDYSGDTTVNAYFPDTAATMLNYEPDAASITVDKTLRYSESILIDGVKSTSTTYSDGTWTGAEGTDLTITVDNKRNITFDTLSIGCLQKISFGICRPESITFYTSADGKTYKEVGKYTGVSDVQSEYDNDDNGAFIERATVTLDSPVSARYVRAVVKNPGTFVKSGTTTKTWLFMDEFEMKSAVTLENLKVLIDTAAAIDDLSTYQPATVLAFDTAYKKAIEFYNSGSLNESKLHEVYTALESAINGLKKSTAYTVTSFTNWTNWSSSKIPEYTNKKYDDYPGRGKVLTDISALTEQNIDFYLDMGSSTSVLSIGYSALSLPNSGIYLQNAEFFVSDTPNGPWTSVGTVYAGAHKGDPTVKEYQILSGTANGAEGRYVKVVFSRDSTHELKVNGVLKRSEWLYLNEILINEFRPITVESENADVDMVYVDGTDMEIGVLGAICGKDVKVNITPHTNAIVKSATVNGSLVTIENNSFVIPCVTSAQNIVLSSNVYSEEEMPKFAGIKDLLVPVSEVEGFDPVIDIAAYDKDGNDITQLITYNTSGLAATKGTYTITYSVTASNGAVAQATTNVHVVDNISGNRVIAATPSTSEIHSRKGVADANILVDGKYAPADAGHANPAYVAWKDTESIEIVIKLDGSKTISELGYSLASAPHLGAIPPDVDFYVTDALSGDKAPDWTYAGTIEALVHPATEYDYIKRTMPVNEITNGYVKAVVRFDDDGIMDAYSNTVGKGKPEWTFVDEIILGDTNELKFAGASITLSDSIAVNYMVEKSQVENYSGLSVKFKLNGGEYTVDKYTEKDGYYIFKCNDIAPHLMTNGIYVTLSGTKSGTEYKSFESVYSIKQYCHNILETTDDTQTEIRKLLVDLLNYGAASQEYYKTNVDTEFAYKKLANADLSEAQANWGTNSAPVLNSVLDLKYATVQNPTVSWKSGGLYLAHSAIMKFTIQADSVENLTVRVKCGEKEWAIDSGNSKNFVSIGDGKYCIYVSGLNIIQMRDDVYLTVYNGNTAVSNTIRYSIESYAASKADDSNALLAGLVKAMIKYGDSAKAYLESKQQ